MAHQVKPKSKSKNKTLTLKVTFDQFRMIEQKAEKCGVDRSKWMRSVLAQAARSTAMQGYLRIREPDGVTT